MAVALALALTLTLTLALALALTLRPTLTLTQVQGTPRWRQMVQSTPLDESLFPLHNPVNYVNWLGTQKKRLVVLEETAEAQRYGRGEEGGLQGSLRRGTPSSDLPGENH